MDCQVVLVGLQVIVVGRQMSLLMVGRQMSHLHVVAGVNIRWVEVAVEITIREVRW